jgi:hypothetical protein
MTKQHFIALADLIRNANATNCDEAVFSGYQINILASFCASQNDRFDRARWIEYIADVSGSNGGKR